MGHRSLQLSKNPKDGYGSTLLFIIFDPNWNHYPPKNGSIFPFQLVLDHSIFLLLLIVYVLITCLGLLEKISNQDG